MSDAVTQKWSWHKAICKRTDYMRLLIVLLLIIASLIGISSANVISQNVFNSNDTRIHQFMFSVDSESMSPNLNIGDIAIIEGTFRTEIITREEATKKEYKSFNLPGDVILYQPYGKELNKSSPIMHRVIRWVEEGKSMWEGGPAAPFSGYITKGDHDEVIDQMAGQIYGEANLSYIQSHRNAIKDVGNDVYIDNETGLIIYKTLNGTFIGDGISFLTPVKKDWILGVVRARIANGSDWTKLGTYNEN